MSPQSIPTVDERLGALLKNIGNTGQCQGCSALIFWVRHSNGKTVPYDAQIESIGTNHFVTCPARDRFKK